MERKRLLFLPFAVGLILLVCSWWLSYPLSIDSTSDIIFNHVSLLYWISLPLLLASLYMINVTSKNNSLKWIATIGIVLTIYSLSYFYYTLPGSDSQAFRGLTEYLIKTKDLDPSKPYHDYFQWPSYFLLNVIATSVCGMALRSFEFLLYTIMGFLFTTSLYVYASRTFKDEGCIAVVSFFVALFYFFNYQDVPFSLAFGLLFLLFMLETKQKNLNVTLTILVLFTGIAFTHVFVPIFFILYLLARYILNRNKSYGRLLLATLIIYLVAQITLSPLFFVENIVNVTISTEYSRMVSAVLEPVSIPIDEIAQMFSRGVTIATAVICLVGFAVLLIKRKMRDLDKAIFLAGAVYCAFGVVSWYALGSRAIPVFFIPISLGPAFLMKSRLRKYVISVFLVLIMLFAFVPFHRTFYTNQIIFQTEEAYQVENFLINYYDWANPSLILAHSTMKPYLQAKQPGLVLFEGDLFEPLFPRVKEYDVIVYTLGLGINLMRYNYTIDRIFQEESSNVIYNNGFSDILIKSSNSTVAPV